MTDTNPTPTLDARLAESRADRADKALTTISGWGALIIGVLALHRWIFGLQIDWWVRAGLIMCFGLTLTWAWGYWPEITARLRQWVRSGGLSTTVIAIVLIASLIIVNTLVRRRLPVKWDFTKNQRFTLAPQSRDVLKNLKDPVKATFFLPGGRSNARTRDLLKQYAEASDKFSYEIVDPLTRPQEIQAKGVTLNQDLSAGVLESGRKRQNVTEFTEKAMTGAFLKLTRGTPKKLLFTTGHGEPPIEAAPGGDPTRSIAGLKGILEEQQWPIESLNLYGKDAAAPNPEEVAAVVVLGPSREFAPEEAKRLEEYLSKGGRVLLALNVSGPTFESFLQPWGIKTKRDLVVDQRTGGLVPATAEGEPHASVRILREARALLSNVRTVSAISPAPAGITVTELVRSSRSSEVLNNFVPGKTNAEEALRTATQGQVSLAALSEKKLGAGDAAKAARMIVVGSSDFAYDAIARQLVGFDNVPLMSGMINYLAEEEALVSIPPKDEQTDQVFLTDDQGRLLLLIHYLDFPLLALILAVFVYLKRR